MRWGLFLLLWFMAGGSPAAPCWKVDYENSRLGFSGVQADAGFTGIFEQWHADICFDPDDLAGSAFAVVVDPGSVNTRASDRDEALRGPEFFHVRKWPEATYETTGFAETENGFCARGQLTLRGVTRSVPLDFEFARDADGGARLTGQAELLRLDFDVGLGEWRDTQWVANEVTVEFMLTLVPR